jgi:hypothetical protein
MRDLRQAIVRLVGSPGYSLPVVLTLALGIGLNALAFAVVETVLLRPLPYPAPEQLVAMWETQPGTSIASCGWLTIASVQFSLFLPGRPTRRTARRNRSFRT